MRKTHTGGTAAPAAALPAVLLLVMLAASLSPIGLMGCSQDGGDGSGGTSGTLAGGAEGYKDGKGEDAQFKGPSGIALDGEGNLYVVDNGNQRIRKIVIASGQVSTYAGDGASIFAADSDDTARFFFPTGITIDSSGNLYVTEGFIQTPNRIRKIDSSSGEVSILAGGTAGYADDNDNQGADAMFFAPNGITIDRNGYLYVADTGNHRIRKIDTHTGQVTTYAGTHKSVDNSRWPIGDYAEGRRLEAQFNMPKGIAIDRSGNFYVTDSHNNRIRKIDTHTEEVSTFAGSGQAGSVDGTGTEAQFEDPSGITIDAAGENLYVTENFGYGGRIRKIVIATKVVSTLAGDGKPDAAGTVTNFSYPGGIIVDAGGTLYVADNGNNRILKIVPQGSPK